MKKVIRLTESDLVRLVKRIINEEENMSSNFKAEANVEDDRLMSFPVISLSDVSGNVRMTIQDPSDKSELYVNNFKGPIYDKKTNKVRYTRCWFNNIDKSNYSAIASEYGIKKM